MTTPTRSFPQVKNLRTALELRARLALLGAELPFDDEVVPAPDGPLAQPLTVAGLTIGNRCTVLPMEGWDGTTDGRPTDLVERRWARFGESGAKLVWGGEAVAVRSDGRANPNQLLISDDSYTDGLDGLRRSLLERHNQMYGRTDDLLIGLQLTHSGRFSRPTGDPKPVVPGTHPVLDLRLAPERAPRVLDPDDLDELSEYFVAAAVRAAAAGFSFVDVKCCHGYLGHELLTRCGADGARLPFDQRVGFLRGVLAGIRRAAPTLALGVRLSVFDLLPWRSGADHVGEPEPWDSGTPYPFAFGGDGTGHGTDLAEAVELTRWLAGEGVSMLCITAGSPYYNPHIQRPAYFPPSDGYLPPEDPLVGVARLLSASAVIKDAVPEMVVIGSGYSYLQDWWANAGQAAVRLGHTDSVGLGRMMLSYPEAPADALAGRPMDRRLICRTFSDCTTAPRHAMVSGCYPLDDFYKVRPERTELADVKAQIRRRRTETR